MPAFFSSPVATRFASDYREARHDFVSAAGSLPDSVVCGLQSYPHPLAGPSGEALACDVLYAASVEYPANVVVLLSATHGVEGFAGSAIQCELMSSLESFLTANPDTGFVFIHAVNPWGFAWRRRCDHEGIDINRNFIDFAQMPANDPEMERLYRQLETMDQGCQSDMFWQQGGLQAFAEILSRGHYLGPAAPFYGGAGNSWSRTVLDKVAASDFIVNAMCIAVIDIHTGLGPYGYGELINDHAPGTDGFAFARRWYGANATSAVLGESCSTLKLGLVDYLWHEVMGKRGCFVTLEFGTYALSELVTVLLAEQLYHNECTRRRITPVPDHPSRNGLAEFFDPREASWQQQVLFRGWQVVSMAIQGMQS